MTERLLLASQSASRRAMLAAAGIAHDAMPSTMDEDEIKAGMAGASMADLAAALAGAKARQVALANRERLVLGGDSIASLGAERFSKPRDRADAARHLRLFSGQVLTLTSAAVLVRGRATIAIVVDTAQLHVRPLSESFIEDYLAREWPAIAGCAGCFRLEGIGVQLFDKVDGDYFTILGMPLLPLLVALRAEGILQA